MASRMKVSAATPGSASTVTRPPCVEDGAAERGEMFEEHRDQSLVARALPHEPEGHAVRGLGRGRHAPELVETPRRGGQQVGAPVEHADVDEPGQRDRARRASDWRPRRRGRSRSTGGREAIERQRSSRRRRTPASRPRRAAARRARRRARSATARRADGAGRRRRASAAAPPRCRGARRGSAPSCRRMTSPSRPSRLPETVSTGAPDSVHAATRLAAATASRATAHVAIRARRVRVEGVTRPTVSLRPVPDRTATTSGRTRPARGRGHEAPTRHGRSAVG